MTLRATPSKMRSLNSGFGSHSPRGTSPSSLASSVPEDHQQPLIWALVSSWVKEEGCVRRLPWSPNSTQLTLLPGTELHAQQGCL